MNNVEHRGTTGWRRGIAAVATAATVTVVLATPAAARPPEAPAPTADHGCRVVEPVTCASASSAADGRMSTDVSLSDPGQSLLQPMSGSGVGHADATVGLVLKTPAVPEGHELAVWSHGSLTSWDWHAAGEGSTFFGRFDAVDAQHSRCPDCQIVYGGQTGSPGGVSFRMVPPAGQAVPKGHVTFSVRLRTSATLTERPTSTDSPARSAAIALQAEVTGADSAVLLPMEGV